MLPVVRTIEAQMSADPTLNHEYLPLNGLKAFTERATKMLLGESSSAITKNCVSCSQEKVHMTELSKYRIAGNIYTVDLG